MEPHMLEKQKLDSQFSILNSLSSTELHRLAQEYLDLKRLTMKYLPEVPDDDPYKRALKNMIVDIADRVDMIYRFLRHAGHSDSAV
jgi:hypothetical protein